MAKTLQLSLASLLGAAVASPTIAATDLDPCRQLRQVWEADKTDEAALARWNECTAAVEARQEKEEVAEAARRKKQEAQRAHQRSLPGASIGMSAEQVRRKSNWGEPESVNSTTTAAGTWEQWVYSSGNYLYFRNGRLSAIQSAR